MTARASRAAAGAASQRRSRSRSRSLKDVAARYRVFYEAAPVAIVVSVSTLDGQSK